ncbi:MAG: class I SAM-dependent methyltransferase [Bacteroidetes bacterium]|nr:class I SAM-dependent methyltransferase [Bacteroidota bacterium]
MNKYTIHYYQCPHCGFVETEAPYWLKEAYERPINKTDVGILERNIQLRDIVASILFFYFDHTKPMLDYAGGYGIFTRLMRDLGFEFLWSDPYTKNLFADGFEFKTGVLLEALTTFETFEHFENPVEEFSKMLSLSKNIIATTQLISTPAPPADLWWYYGLEHGQHISFYTKKSFEILAEKFQLNYHTNGINIHIFTSKVISPRLLRLIFRYHHRGIFRYVRKRLTSKTVSDMEYIIQSLKINS